jgi:hypothetical protein
VKFGTSFRVMKDPGNEECQGGVVTLDTLVVLVALSYHWLALTCHWLLDGFDTSLAPVALLPTLIASESWGALNFGTYRTTMEASDSSESELKRTG